MKKDLCGDFLTSKKKKKLTHDGVAGGNSRREKEKNYNLLMFLKVPVEWTQSMRLILTVLE